VKRRTGTWAALAAVVALIVGLVAWRLWPLSAQVGVLARGPAIEAVYATGVVEPTVMVPVAPRTGARLVTLEVDEGAAVHRGQVLARLEADDLNQTVQEMQARERLAQSQHERTRTLVEQKFLSPAELDRTRAELQAAQAALQRSRVQRDYTQLVAPADGVVLRRDGEPGQFVPAGQTVFSISCCAPLRVAAEVDEEDIARVRVGQAVTLRSDALPDRLFGGEVAEITPKGDPVARSYRVRLRFKDSSAQALEGLRSGMTMDANIIISRRESALLVPTRALTSTGASAALWVLEQGRASRRPVRTGVTGSERTELLSGVAEGAAVLLNPPEGLREGQRVRRAEAAASDALTVSAPVQAGPASAPVAASR